MTVRVEPNYWMRRVAAENTDTTPIRTRSDILEDVLYAVALVTIWVLATAVITWKTLPGGIEALPMFLILEGMYTTCVILAWAKTR